MAETESKSDDAAERDAVDKLRAAGKAIRAAFSDDPECKVLLSAVDTAEAAASDCLDEDGADEGDDVKPTSLKTAAERTRQEFSRRKAESK